MGRIERDCFMENIITVENLKFRYDDQEEDSKLVLDNVNVTVRKGEFLAILGHNGSGKSTTAKHFNAILLPTSGEVLVDGINTKKEDELFNIRQRVGMVFQNPDNQIVATIVEEDVAFALENMGVEPSEIRKRVDAALEDVGMSEYKEHAPHKLSGGQKQRIAIAGIIAMRPKVIVLDEPTAMLDPQGRREVMKTLKKLNKEHGVTVVIITHYMDEAAQSDRIIVMEEGQQIVEGVPSEVFANVALLKQIGLDVPQVTELLFELRRAGLPVRHDIITEDECIVELEKILSRRGETGSEKVDSIEDDKHEENEKP